MLRQKKEKGVTDFMRKLGTGYTNYFNQKYHRVGSLFQGKYKIVHVKKEEHFLHLPFYIHFNPLDLIEPRWKERRLKNADKASKFLESYRWSSYPDYIGKKNFPSVTQRKFLLEVFNSPEQYRVSAMNWLKEIGPQKISGLVLENLGNQNLGSPTS
jgi:putative transposase